MATIKAHLDKAAHDEALFNFLKEKGDYLDWQVVTLFYATLHKVQAMLRIAGYPEMDTDSHVKVKNILKSAFPSIGVDYTLLLSLSHASRYDADREMNSEDVNKAQELFNSIDKKIKGTTTILIRGK